MDKTNSDFKIGTDIIEVDRIKEAMQDENFAKRVFTDKEIEYCEAKNKSKYQSYAARFAAKEAIFKALSSHLNNKYEMSWKNAEILNDEDGRPYVNLIDVENLGLKNVSVDVSLSHLGAYAVATAIVFDTNPAKNVGE